MVGVETEARPPFGRALARPGPVRRPPRGPGVPPGLPRLLQLRPAGPAHGAEQPHAPPPLRSPAPRPCPALRARAEGAPAIPRPDMVLFQLRARAPPLPL